MEPLATFVDRLKHATQIREGELGVRIMKKDLAAAAGVSSSAVTLWYKGKTAELKAASVFGLASYLKVRAEWLRNNEGPMRANGAAREPADTKKSAEPKLSREAVDLIEMITEADKAGAITKSTLKAFSTIISDSAAHAAPHTASMTLAGLERRMQRVVQKRPTKTKKGKGAA